MSEVNPTPSAEPSAESSAIPYAQPSTGAKTGTITAKPSAWYRGKRLLLVLVMVGYGCLSIRDGFFRYPQENEDAKKHLKTKPHPEYDIPFNQGFGIGLPPLGIALLIWTFYLSRGRYELNGEMLSIPGHPPIPLSSIQTVDRRKWDRKGIAVMTYTTGGASGTFKLDDFIYDREPTDEIFKRIEAAVSTPG